MRHVVPVCAVVVAVGSLRLGGFLMERAESVARAAGETAPQAIRRASAAPSALPDRVSIPGGAFLMGSDAGEGNFDEHPRHLVTIAPFDIDRYEVTNARYAACVHAGACRSPAFTSSQSRTNYFGNPAFAEYPVIFVDFGQAEEFCRWSGGRLPSEAEWEYAARGPAPSVRLYPWGDERPTCERANMGGAEGCTGDTDCVGRRPLGASPFGVLDMAGNVWEWTQDWYDAHYYEKTPSADPHGPSRGTLKVMRGGCWMSGSDSLRVACRKAELPSSWAPNVGFRCAYSEPR